MKYHLSGRQAKELVARGRSLYVAIPAPNNCDDIEPLDYAREALPDVSEFVTDAELIDLWCIPSPGTGGLTGVLGEIYMRKKDEQFGYWVSAIAITLEPRKPRHPPLPLAWAGSVIDGSGQHWPIRPDVTL